MHQNRTQMMAARAYMTESHGDHSRLVRNKSGELIAWADISGQVHDLPVCAEMLSRKVAAELTDGDTQRVAVDNFWQEDVALSDELKEPCGLSTCLACVGIICALNLAVAWVLFRIFDAVFGVAK